MQEIYQIIAMYAPTVLTALGVIASYTKIFFGLKNNSKNIINDPGMVKLRDELRETRETLAVLRSQVSEMTRRQGELINELSKVVKYEDGKNDKM